MQMYTHWYPANMCQITSLMALGLNTFHRAKTVGNIYLQSAAVTMAKTHSLHYQY